MCLITVKKKRAAKCHSTNTHKHTLIHTAAALTPRREERLTCAWQFVPPSSAVRPLASPHFLFLFLFSTCCCCYCLVSHRDRSGRDKDKDRDRDDKKDKDKDKDRHRDDKKDKDR